MARRFAPAFRALGVCEHSRRHNNKNSDKLTMQGPHLVRSTEKSLGTHKKHLVSRKSHPTRKIEMLLSLFLLYESLAMIYLIFSFKKPGFRVLFLELANNYISKIFIS